MYFSYSYVYDLPPNSVFFIYSSIIQIIQQQKLIINAKLNKKDKFNKYVADNNGNVKYNMNTELNKKAK